MAPTCQIFPWSSSEQVLWVHLPVNCSESCRSPFDGTGMKQDDTEGMRWRDAHPTAAPQSFGSQLHLCLCWLMAKEISSSLLITRTSSDQLLHDSTCLMQSFKQGVIVIHQQLFFRLKSSGACDVNIEQTCSFSGSGTRLLPLAGLLASV